MLLVIYRYGCNVTMLDVHIIYLSIKKEVNICKSNLYEHNAQASDRPDCHRIL